MNYIIGTAGHVDHGKTALIKALTGIETTHLPEEKKRGMTIDLGFAYFNNTDGTPIGVIDVPGHERFIRNMTAGMWSLDCVLLVVAADDGWMQMTTDHLKTAHAMGIKNIILTVTKTDLSDDETLELVIEEAGEKCAEIIGRELPVVKTCAHTGAGIEELRSMIIKTLKKSSPPGGDFLNSNTNPMLYIDRVFSLQGVGITITGSLKNGILSKNDDVFLFPGAVPGKVKGIQSHYMEKETAESSSRVALKIKLSKKTDVKRGMLVARLKDQIFVEREMLIKIDSNSLNEGSRIKNHKEVELAFGTAHETGKLHLLEKGSDIARVILKNEAAFYWKQPGVLIPHGGNSIIGAFKIIWAGKTGRAKRLQIADIISNRNPSSYDEMLLMSEGFLKDISSIKLRKNSESLKIGSWIFDNKKLEELNKKIPEVISENPGGLTEAEIISKTGLPSDVVKELLNYYTAQNKIILQNRSYLNSQENGITSEFSLNAQKIYTEAEKAEKAGIVVSKMGIPGGQKEARGLVRAGLIVHLEDGLYYSRKTYDKLKSDILGDYKSGDTLSIAEAKEKSGLSRKFLIPLLNLMESEKLIRREGDNRKIL